MKKKSFSLEKLPTIFKQKKQIILIKSRHLEQKIKAVQQQNKINLQQDKLQTCLLRQPSLTMRYFSQKKIDYQTKPKQYSSQKKNIIQHIAMKKIRAANQKYSSIKLNKFEKLDNQNPKQYISTIAKISTLKIDLNQIRLKREAQDNNKKIISFRQRNSLFIPEADNDQRQNQIKLLPFYQAKQYQNIPFTKINQTPQKTQIRFINGSERWIQNQKLYNRISLPKNYQSKQQIVQFDKQLTQKQIKILDKQYLDRLLQNFIRNCKSEEIFMEPQMKQLLKQELQYNYDMSSKHFSNNYKRRTQKNKKVKIHKNKNSYADIKQNLNLKYLCSQNLQFLVNFNVSKNKYLNYITKCHQIISQFNFLQHFDCLYTINSAGGGGQKQLDNDFVSSQHLSSQIQKVLSLKKDKIDLIIFKTQQQISELKNKIIRDLQYYIKLNPRFKQFNYQLSLELFIKKCKF